LSLAIPVTSHAEDCNANDILRSNVALYKNDISIFVASQNVYNRDFQAGHKGGGSFAYDGVPLSATDAGNLADAVHQMTSYTMSDNESTFLLLSTLDDKTVDAYIACLNQKKPILFKSHRSAVDQTEFPLHIIWQPDYVTPSHAQLAVTVLHGTVNGKRKAVFNVSPTENVPVTIKRDNNGFDPVYVSASVYGKSDDFVLPGIPNFIVKLQEKDSITTSLCRSGGCGTSYVTYAVPAIRPDGDGRLLPGTLSFVGSNTNPNQMWSCPDAHPEINPKRCSDYHPELNDALHAVGELRGFASANEADNKISGYFRVSQVVHKLKSDLDPSIKSEDQNAPMEPSPYHEPQFIPDIP
jgi:hypothetical protein